MRSIPFLAALLALVLAASIRPATADDAAWRSRLSANDPIEVLRIVDGLRAAPDASAALPLLDAGLATREPSIAVACGDALRAIGEGAATPPVREAVARAARERDPARIENLARILGGWRHSLVDVPLAGLVRPRAVEGVRAEALHMIAAMGAVDPSLFPETTAAVARGLGDSQEVVRIAACDAAGERRLLALAPTIVDLVVRAGPGTRDVEAQFAVLALERMGWHGDLHGLVSAALRDPGSAAACGAMRAVATVSRSDDIPLLGTLLHARPLEAPVAAALAIARLAREGALPPAAAQPEWPHVLADLVALAGGAAERPEVRYAARLALGALGGAARDLVLPALPSWLSRPQEDVVLGAMDLAGALRAEALGDPLRKIALSDAPPHWRRAASRALAAIDGPAAVERWSPWLGPTATKGGRFLRSVEALGYAGSPAAVKRLIDLLREVEDAPGGRQEVERALERLTGRRLGPHPERWAAWLAKTPSPLRRTIALHDRAALRRECARTGRFGVTPTTEAAVDRGLLWLARRQGALGEIADAPLTTDDATISHTALSVLAFLGAGCGEFDGCHREAVRRAVRYLCARRTGAGAPGPVRSRMSNTWNPLGGVGRMVGPLACCGLAEACAFGRSEAARVPAQLALDVLGSEQHPSGGFMACERVVLGEHTAPTAWAVWACVQAAAAGLAVPQRYLDGADAWLSRASTDPSGLEEDPEDPAKDHADSVGARMKHVVYVADDELGEAQRLRRSQAGDEDLSDMGLAVRFLLGWPRWHPWMVGAGNALVEHPPAWMAWTGEGAGRTSLYSYWLWGSHSAHVLGGWVARVWRERLGRMLEANQRRFPADVDGSWEFDARRQSDRSDTYATACAVLALEAPYRLPPP